MLSYIWLQWLAYQLYGLIHTYVYSTEIFTPKLRHIFAGIFEMPFGYYAFGLISYLNRTWTGIHIWVGITLDFE